MHERAFTRDVEARYSVLAFKCDGGVPARGEDTGGDGRFILLRNTGQILRIMRTKGLKL